jgi:ABC-type lipoprotein release transport system permease subunit
MGRHSIGLLIVAICIGMLAGSILGQIMGVVIDSLGLQNNVVQAVFVNSYAYEFFPIRLNLMIMTFTFGFSINLNILSLLGIGTAWYYIKYSY